MRSVVRRVAVTTTIRAHTYSHTRTHIHTLARDCRCLPIRFALIAYTHVQLDDDESTTGSRTSTSKSSLDARGAHKRNRASNAVGFGGALSCCGRRSKRAHTHDTIRDTQRRIARTRGSGTGTGHQTQRDYDMMYICGIVEHAARLRIRLRWGLRYTEWMRDEWERRRVRVEPTNCQAKPNRVHNRFALVLLPNS